jgi:predicted Fe-S protein YdhL (DUF1289 family)
VAAALEGCVNAADGQVAQRANRPPSPCINVCSLDARGWCVGCLRSGEEIAQWLAMSAEEQWRLLEVLKERRRLNQQVT